MLERHPVARGENFLGYDLCEALGAHEVSEWGAGQAKALRGNGSLQRAK